MLRANPKNIGVPLKVLHKFQDFPSSILNIGVFILWKLFDHVKA